MAVGARGRVYSGGGRRGGTGVAIDDGGGGPDAAPFAEEFRCGTVTDAVAEEEDEEEGISTSTSRSNEVKQKSIVKHSVHYHQ